MNIQMPQETHERASPPNRKPSLFKWVSTTELVFVFMACTVAAVLLRTQDKLRFSLVWNDTLTMNSFGNKRFPTENEKM